MMPEGTDGTLAPISRRLTETELSRTMIVSVGADATAHAVADARRIASALRELPEVGWLRTGVDEDQTGANRVAVEAERSIHEDVRARAIPSTLGVAALVFAFYRSLQNCFLASLPVRAGILVAIATGIFVFRRLDGITLGFGAALGGIVIDYPICLLTHVILAGRGTPMPDGGWQCAGELVSTTAIPDGFHLLAQVRVLAAPDVAWGLMPAAQKIDGRLVVVGRDGFGAKLFTIVPD